MSELNIRIGHLDGIESPWGNAGGVVRTLEEVELMSKSGVGWIEAGSYTIPMRLGNAVDPTRIEAGEVYKVRHYDPVTGEMTNSLGMPNKGIHIVKTEMPEMVDIAHAHNKKFVANVAPVSDNPAKELQELVEIAYESKADAVLVNAGCPNVLTEDGGRHEILSYKPKALFTALNGLSNIVSKYKPVYVRLSPYEDYHIMLTAAQAVKFSRVVSAVFMPNTWPNHIPLNENGEPILQVRGNAGGLSGPAVAMKAYVQATMMAKYLEGSGIDVVSSSGIMNGAELKSRLEIPGVVAGAGTTFYYESENGWQDDTNKLLSELAA